MISDIFEAHFGAAPQTVARAHGRVNLIGDHTDYNGGLVMPCLLGRATDVALSLCEAPILRGCSDKFDPAEIARGAPCDGSWLDFVQGALAMLEPYRGWRGGVDVAVQSSVPAGAGVSSSAALEIALLRGLCRLLDLDQISAIELARLAQRIEHEFVGTKCGIMDQMVSSAASPGKAMMLDCESLAFALNPLFASAAFVVMHSGSSRKLSDGLYNTRLAECQRVAALLGLDSLRPATMDMVAGVEDPTLQRRARHVISENERVTAAANALQANDAPGFGALMTASHASLRDDYAVSSDELDRLVTAFAAAGALGARLTGAGFGGCVVALCMNDDVETIVNTIKNDIPDAYLVDVISAVDTPN